MSSGVYIEVKKLEFSEHLRLKWLFDLWQELFRGGDVYEGMMGPSELSLSASRKKICFPYTRLGYSISSVPSQRQAVAHAGGLFS